MGPRRSRAAAAASQAPCLPNGSARVAICYYGLTRSTTHVYRTHHERLFDVLRSQRIAVRVYVHTWSVPQQDVWGIPVAQAPNESEALLLQPDRLQRDEQQPFLSQMRERWPDLFEQQQAARLGVANMGSIEVPRAQLMRNHLCALESQRRCLAMVRGDERAGAAAPHHALLFVRPDALLQSDFPVAQLRRMGEDEVILPHVHGWGGYNDRFAALCAARAALYADRIDGVGRYRKQQAAAQGGHEGGGRLHAEKYLKHTLDASGMRVRWLGMRVGLVRPDGLLYHA